MNIPIIYVSSRRPVGLNISTQPIIVLAKDVWDDYGYKTSFDVYLADSATSRLLGQVRILVENEFRTSNILDATEPSPYGGHVVEFGSRKFISLGAGLEYYENLMNTFDRAEWESILERLHDVVYLEQKAPTTPNLDLRSAEGFSVSLLRGKDATRGYGDARELLYAEEFIPTRFNFSLTFKGARFSQPHVVDFRFDNDFVVPTRTTVLIGKNGLGKTQTLYSLIDCLTGADTASAGEPFSDNTLSQRPPFRCVVSVSFSPFERFPLGETSTIKNPQMPRYSYCGFRTNEGWGGPKVAWLRTTQALKDIVDYDMHKRHAARPKLPSVLRVLKDGLAFDKILVPLRDEAPLSDDALESVIIIDGKRFVNIDQATLRNMSSTCSALAEASSTETLCFLDKDGLVTKFSAGQAMFVFMVFTVVAAIEAESLIVIDEPELCLHPNLLVAYLRMLSTLLDLFESYAVLATHSEFVAREYPARNVRVFFDADDASVVIRPPSIETFGADLSEIANLVFDNIAERKPFEEWLDVLAEKETDFASFKAKYAKAFNTEAMTYLRNAFAARRREQEGDG